MPPQSLPAIPSGKPTAWQEAIYAFLVEKRSRSGSTRTVESYAGMLWPFFRATTPVQVRSADVLAYAHGIGASGRCRHRPHVPEAKADLLHAIYERIVVAGRTFVSAPLTPAAYAHGLTLAMPEKVAMARPTVSESTT
jgi:hypothetical protein